MGNQSLKETPKTQSNPQTQVQGQNQQPKQKTVKLIIKRQDNSESKPYEESFEIPYKENLNVIACLMEIRRNPVNSKGEKTTPVTWDEIASKKYVALVQWLLTDVHDNHVQLLLIN